MTDVEKRLLIALAGMVDQYLREGDGLDNMCMSAGEDALKELAAYGLITISHGGRCGRWTEAGEALLRSN